jgi:hypothetical protein
MTKILDRFNIGYADLISADRGVQNKVEDVKIDSDDTNVFSYYRQIGVHGFGVGFYRVVHNPQHRGLEF